MIKYDVWKDGKNKAVTMSYDDGAVSDKRLIEIFDKYKIKGTFHINSGNIGTQGHFKPEEIREIYKNHELAAHGVSHLTLTQLPFQNIIPEIYGDRQSLERVIGKAVVGMSYANGAFNDNVVNGIKGCGIVYSRTTLSTMRFCLPENFLMWHPTCHHRDAPQAVDKFLDNAYNRGMLLYIWGHSYEFDRDNNWELIEGVCKKLAFRDDIWYATNIEIYDYTMAVRRLRITADNRTVYNPTATDVWIKSDETVIKVGGGETVHIS